jgi:hypothetical protein
MDGGYLVILSMLPFLYSHILVEQGIYSVDSGYLEDDHCSRQWRGPHTAK